MSAAQPKTIRLADYASPDYRVEEVHLAFDLDEKKTKVTSRLKVRSDHDRGSGVQPLVLDGDELKLVSVKLDGKPLSEKEYVLDEASLRIPSPPEKFELEIETEIDPSANTKLEGLYVSGGNFCTQCEAEGFRRITFYPDRPDVMAVFTTTIRADKKSCPVLLSNGNRVSERSIDGGRHEAVWHDPFPKPSYLFALVAGDLVAVEDTFVTASGRTVKLCIYVEEGNQNRCAYAMDALKRAMRWDEETFGLEYDLDVFNIVAVNDFNMGAMENKSLNVFNAKYVLASPETATDADYAAIESIVAHEYFHNWTGNRVTCRDWFQLSLKEGLTVFRDQLFSADMRSAPVRRIADVRALRARQVPEDAGPLAHPVRPESYIEINNFYTPTVYEKGAEVIRMIHTLLGREGFRRGMDLYFERHDGQAVTCDDFVQAMEDATGVDLGQFRLWYSQAGTPELSVEGKFDSLERSFHLKVKQRTPPTPGQPEKKPVHLPLKVALLDRRGRELPLRFEGEGIGMEAGERVLNITEAEQTFRFLNVPLPPVPSINRGFGAPVRLKIDLPEEDRAFLMGYDTDRFNRWEAGQQYATDLLLRAVRNGTRSGPIAPDFVEALRRTIEDAVEDRAFAAQMLTLPSEDYIGEQMEIIDVEAIHTAREKLRREIATNYKEELLTLYRDNRSNEPFSPDAASAGRRALKNAALSYLALIEEPGMRALVKEQYFEADNMTDRMAALAALNDIAAPDRQEALDDFYRKFQSDTLVVDKWFALQATSSLPQTLERVKELLDHEAFSIRNPNKVRALVGAFASGNPLRFHAQDGSGYAFLADRVIELDKLNPQTAARLLGPLGRWRRFDKARQEKMQAALRRVLAEPKLSRDVYEIASKSLGEAAS